MPEELDKDLDYLCIVPGLEGHYERFSVLCKSLKMAAMVLQPGIDYPNETIPEMAKRLVEVTSAYIIVSYNLLLILDITVRSFLYLNFRSY